MKQLSENSLDHRPRLIGPGCALIGLHWQKDVVAPGGALDATFATSVMNRQVIPRTAKLMNFFRSQGARVIYVNVQFEPNSVGLVVNNALWSMVSKSQQFLRDTEGVKPVAELKPEPDDVVLYHDRISGFYGTNLVGVLVGNKISDVYITGVATNVAVDHTARDAVQFGFNTFVVEDCCASSNPDFHEASMMTLRLLCTGVVTSDSLLAGPRS